MNTTTFWTGLGAVVTVFVLMGTDASAAPVTVTNNADAGPGSFRSAVTVANADASVGTIRFDRNIKTITLASVVEYTGAQSLHVLGRGAAINSGGGAFDLFASVGGGDLRLDDLTFSDGGGSGIYVFVPTGTQGDVRTKLDRVTVADNGLHGVHIEEAAGGSAGIRLDVRSSIVSGNGFLGATDFDGIRVDESGPGDVRAVLLHTQVDGNGADGLELNDADDGSVYLIATHSSFDGNGFKDPTDLDDGLDIDEAGAGGIDVRLIAVSMSGNADEGMDVDEEQAGAVTADLTLISAIGNGDENIKLDEEDDGGLTAVLRLVTASDSGDEEGVSFGETGTGDLAVRVIASSIVDNADDGLQLDEEDDGNLTLLVLASTVSGNAKDGIKPEELSSGDFEARIVASTVANNGDDVTGHFGVDAEQEAPGNGQLILQAVTFGGNAAGPIDVDGIVVVGGP